MLKASGDVDPLIKCNLHRNLGLLAAAKNNFEEAKREFAEDVSSLPYKSCACYQCSCIQVYQASLGSSPNAVEAAGGYFHIAGIFLRENKPQVASSLHDKARK